MKFSKVKTLATTGATAIYLGLMNAQVVLAADGGEVKSKLTDAGKTIQGILTGLASQCTFCCISSGSLFAISGSIMKSFSEAIRPT